MTDACLLRLKSPDRYAWRHWDGELVFFDELSGDTRLIQGWSGAVLDLIAKRQPIGVESIERELASAMAIPQDDAFHAVIQGAVTTLRNYRLIDDTAL
jgi:PqqD family protein of HPr-rel-A system